MQSFRCEIRHHQCVDCALWLCLQKCCKARLNLNLAICEFVVASSMLLGHIVSKEGKEMDPDKVKAIFKTLTLKNVKALSYFLEQIWWHSRMIRYLAEFATPLQAVVHREPFLWIEEEEKAFSALKILMSQAPILQSKKWNKPFHAFVDASKIAIGSA